MAIISQQALTVPLNARQAAIVLNRLPRTVSGRAGAGGLVRVLQVRLGLALLRFVHKAFVTKSDGGTDEAGTRWRPLSPVTVSLRASKQGKRGSFVDVLKKERRRWREVYEGALRSGADRQSAGRIAWQAARREGLRTLFGTGGQLARILIDSGTLEKSLRPGVPPEAAAFSPPHVPLQVFRLGNGQLEVGTRRKWALAQHRGAPGRRPPLPQRRLWPKVVNWPPSWWRQMTTQAVRGIQDIIVHMLRR